MTEGQRGGEFFTPTSIVKLIVAIIEPFDGRILDPGCAWKGWRWQRIGVGGWCPPGGTRAPSRARVEPHSSWSPPNDGSRSCACNQFRCREPVRALARRCAGRLFCLLPRQPHARGLLGLLARSARDLRQGAG